MLAFYTLLKKEFAQQRSIILLLWGLFCLLILLIGIKWPSSFLMLPAGELSFVLILWQILGVVLTATLLSDLAVASDYRARVDNFIETLPIGRWKVLLAKYTFVLAGTTAISWSLFVYSGLVILILNLRIRQDIQLFLTESLPFSIVDFQRTLGEFDQLPWRDLSLNALTGISLISVMLVIGSVFRGKIQEKVSGRLSLPGCLGLFGATTAAVIAIVSTSSLLSNKTIDFEIEGKPVARFSHGKTIVKLYAASGAPSVLDKDQDLRLSSMAENLETVRQAFDPPWWPASFVIVPGDTGEEDGDARSTNVAGLDFVVNCSIGDLGKRNLDAWIAEKYFESTTFGGFHRDRYSWVYAGIGEHVRIFNAATAGKDEFSMQVGKDFLDRVKKEGWTSLETWLELEDDTHSRDRARLSSEVLSELRRVMGEDEFFLWLRRVGRSTLVRPEANTLLEWNRGRTFWTGVSRRGAIPILPGSVNFAEVFDAAVDRVDLKPSDS